MASLFSKNRNIFLLQEEHPGPHLHLMPLSKHFGGGGTHTSLSCSGSTYCHFHRLLPPEPQTSQHTNLLLSHFGAHIPVHPTMERMSGTPTICSLRRNVYGVAYGKERCLLAQIWVVDDLHCSSIPVSNHRLLHLGPLARGLLHCLPGLLWDGESSSRCETSCLPTAVHPTLESTSSPTRLPKTFLSSLP